MTAGSWRGGTVAVKVLCHEGSRTAKLNALHESVVCAHVQHPNVVRPTEGYISRSHCPEQVRTCGIGHENRFSTGYSCACWVLAGMLHLDLCWHGAGPCWDSMTPETLSQIVTYKIHTVLKDTSLAGDVDEQDDEAFIRSLKIRTLCELPKHGRRAVTR